LLHLTRERLGPELVSVIAVGLIVSFAVKQLVDDAGWVYAIGSGLLFTVGIRSIAGEDGGAIEKP